MEAEKFVRNVEAALQLAYVQCNTADFAGIR